MIQQIDAPLRDDVRLLGNLLGETLKQHAGQDLFNQVEQNHAVRSRRQSEFDENAPSPNPLDHLFQKFKAHEISSDALYQQICELKIELVLTAHPTEVSRRTLIQKYDGINDCLFKFDQQKLTPRERQAVLEDLKQLICSAWQTDEIRQHRPTPVDEAK